MSVQTSTHHELPLFACNACLTILKLFEDAPTSSGRPHKRYWTSCRHVLCHTCRPKNCNVCPVCKRNAQFMEISRRMPKHYQLHFDSLSKMQELFNSVMKFQKDQNSLYHGRKLREIDRKGIATNKRTDDNKNRKEAYRKAVLRRNKLKIIHGIIGAEKKRTERIREQQRLHQNEHQGRVNHGNERQQYDGHRQRRNSRNSRYLQNNRPHRDRGNSTDSLNRRRHRDRGNSTDSQNKRQRRAPPSNHGDEPFQLSPSNSGGNDNRVYRPIHRQEYPPIHQPVHQPVQQPIHQPIHQPVHQPVHHHQPPHRPTHQPAQRPIQRSPPHQQDHRHNEHQNYHRNNPHPAPHQRRQPTPIYNEFGSPGRALSSQGSTDSYFPFGRY